MAESARVERACPLGQPLLSKRGVQYHSASSPVLARCHDRSVPRFSAWPLHVQVGGLRSASSCEDHARRLCFQPKMTAASSWPWHRRSRRTRALDSPIRQNRHGYSDECGRVLSRGHRNRRMDHGAECRAIEPRFGAEVGTCKSRRWFVLYFKRQIQEGMAGLQPAYARLRSHPFTGNHRSPCLVNRAGILLTIAGLHQVFEFTEPRLLCGPHRRGVAVSRERSTGSPGSLLAKLAQSIPSVAYSKAWRRKPV